MVNLKWFICKNKLVIYSGAFVKLYKLKIWEKVCKIYKIIKLGKKYISIKKNPYNYDIY